MPISSTVTRTPAIDRRIALHRMIWRWHFYAGLFCIPFVIALAITGSIYLFRPQIESWLDAPYRHIGAGTPARAADQVQAAIAAVPGSTLRAYGIPSHADDAAEVLVARAGTTWRVYVHPDSAAVLRVVAEEERPMRVIAHLHGELLLGDRGSMIVELAASWAIVLLLTGLYLWWPPGWRGAAGVLYPRIGAERKVFWRDLHAVTAFWVSGLALFLLVSGLPWAKSWGSLLKEVRQISGESRAHADWPVGAATDDAHEAAGHVHASGADGAAVRFDPSALDRVVAVARTLDLASPVLVSPSGQRSEHWTAKSDAANRPLRADVVLDADGRVLQRTTFAQRPLVDRVVGYGVAAHEGQLFGAMNQALGVFTAIGLVIICVSAVQLWWRRRPAGTLGARASIAGRRVPLLLVAVVVLLAIALPLLGITLAVLMVIERQVLRRVAPISRFLGLAEA